MAHILFKECILYHSIKLHLYYYFFIHFFLFFSRQVLADAVSRLVVDKFSELTDNFASPHARRKVLAGVVMTTGNLFLS